MSDFALVIWMHPQAKAAQRLPERPQAKAAQRLPERPQAKAAQRLPERPQAKAAQRLPERKKARAWADPRGAAGPIARRPPARAPARAIRWLPAESSKVSSALGDALGRLRPQCAVGAGLP